MKPTRKTTHTICRLLLPLVAALFCVINICAQDRKEILVITSYNPDTQKMYSTLSDFTGKLRSLDGDKYNVSIESMNCQYLSEAYLWKDRMAGILDGYVKNPPALIILLGQEAWASYLSQTSSVARHTPCMAGLVSTNTVVLPDNHANFKYWMPDSKEYSELTDFNIAGGVFYRYDIEENLKLLRRFYPQKKELLLLTDNTFGGLAMQAHVAEQMKQHKDIRLKLLDGRQNTLFEISKKLKAANKDNVLWIGTWRIDSNENYAMASTVDVLSQANKALPAFSLSSVGMGNWAIGGYVPEYSPQGEKLALLVHSFFRGERKHLFVTLPCKLSIDEKQLEAFGKEYVKLPSDAVVINTNTDFLSAHIGMVLWIVGIILVLALGLAYAVYDIVRIRRYKDTLLKNTRELVEAKEQAEAANKIKTSFIANMSHEIRTPLNAIVGFTDLIVQDDYDKADKKQFGTIIKENSDILLNLINEILDISRIESGRINISYEDCDVVSLCRNALVSVKQTTKLPDVEFRDVMPEERLVIKTDPIRLRQVVTNLLSNAVKFTKQGSITLSLNIDRKENQLLFSVADTGTGIPADKAEYVFERFAKLNRYVQGTGLGLPLCRIIVGCLGGKIWVDTDYVEGACLKFTHPLNMAENNGNDNGSK